MGLVQGLPKGENSPVLSKADISAAKLNNQFCLKGTNPQIPQDLTQKKIIIFLEYVAPVSGTFLIHDSSANVLTGALSELPLQESPLRIDGGCKAVGDIAIMKGFFIIKDNLTEV